MMDEQKEQFDAASAPLPNEVPWITNEVNGSISYRCPDGISGWARSRKPPNELPPGLRYGSLDDPDEMAFFESLFLGIRFSNYREEWFLRCYAAMRERDDWDVCIAAEQRIADQYAEIISELPPPPGPAAIQ